MKTLIVIPARYASSRFPGKPLVSETGLPLIQHVWLQAKRAKLAADVVVATDDERIAEAVRGFGGLVEMTRDDHPSGTDRIAEVAAKREGYDLIVNVQGDEPEIEPENIDFLIAFHQAARPQMGTLACPFSVMEGTGSPSDPNSVKVVLGMKRWEEGGRRAFDALYFSRSLIPYPRREAGAVKEPSKYYLHLGIYSYSPEFVTAYAKQKRGVLEETESLEQLRVLENGGRIVVGIIDKAPSGIDTPEDYAAFVQRFKGEA